MINREKASALFRGLHAPGSLLVLANAWDGLSARLIEEAGAPAIATTSAGVAWAHGRADGHGLGIGPLLATVGEIARVIHVPLSVDVEAGYSDDLDQVADLVRAVAEAGGVGINLEDGAASPDVLCRKIEAARRGAARSGVDVFINARTDVYLRALVPPERALAETLDRVARYRAAGCDGIFVPRLAPEQAVRTVVDAIAPLPLNLLAGPGLPAKSELLAQGVRRLSAGSAIAAAAYELTRRLAADFVASGRSDSLFVGTVDYGAVNALLAAT